MLDSCAQLLDEVGYDGLTTTQLAERAGVAIGSVYQFFPDKRAVVQALTIRTFDAYLRQVTARLAESGYEHWWGAVGAAIDEYVAMHRNVPGFRALRFAEIVERHLLDADDDTDDAVTEQLTALLGEALLAVAGSGAAESTAGGSAAADAGAADVGAADAGAADSAVRLAVAVAVEIIEALVGMAFRRDPDGDAAVLAECRAVVREYLRSRLAVPDPTGDGAPASSGS